MSITRRGVTTTDGVIPEAAIPAAAVDVTEFATAATFPATGNAGTFYIDAATNKIFRWNGTQYIEIPTASGTLAETTDIIIQNESNTSLDYVSARRFWVGITQLLSGARTWLAKQTFTTAPRFNSTIEGILEVNATKDLISAAKLTAHNKDFALLADAEGGISDTVVMSPLRTQNFWEKAKTIGQTIKNIWTFTQTPVIDINSNLRPFDLTVISSLFLRSDELITAGALSQWNDQSGNENNVTQGTTAAQPTVILNALNELSVARFDGGDFISTTPVFTLKPFTIIAVIKPTSFTAYPSIIAAPTNGAIQFRFTASGNLELLKQGIASIGVSATSNIINNVVITGVTYDASGNFAFYRNGSVDGSGLNNQTILPDKIQVGGRGTELLTGDIAELLIFNSVLTTADRESIEGYLAEKYALKALLPSAHPYKTNAPLVTRKNVILQPFAQTRVDGIAQIINSSTPTKITGASTFIETGKLFTNGGLNNLTIRYIGEASRNVEFNYKVEVREDPVGLGADGTVNIFLTVNGATIAASKITAPVDAIHGGTATGSFIRLCSKDEVFDLRATRNTGGGNGAILNVTLSTKLL